MLKKTLILISLVLAAVSGIVAQSWTVYPLYNGSIEDMVETPTKLYYISNGSLYSYDKDTDETYAYTNANKLSDAIVSGIDYNRKYKFLLVRYANCNMDALYEDGRVVNMPEIYNANLGINKTINSLNISDDYINIATNFGYVIYDADKLVVKESRNWEKSLYACAVWRNHVVIQYGNDTMVAALDQPHSKLEDFKVLHSNAYISKIQVIGNEMYWKHRTSNNVCIFTGVDLSVPKCYYDGVKLHFTRNNWFKSAADGYYLVCDEEILNFDNEGKQLESTTLPALFKNSQLVSWEGTKSVWHASKDGVANYNISSSAPTLLKDYYQPEGAICQAVAYIKPSIDGERIYVTNTYLSRNRSATSPLVADAQTTDMIENGSIRNVSIADHGNVKPNCAFAPGLGMVVEYPFDPSMYMIGSWFDGIQFVKDRVEVFKFSKPKNTAPFIGIFGNWKIDEVNSMAIDKNNNLWVLSGQNTPPSNEQTMVSMLPAEKLKNYAQVTTADWQVLNIPATFAGDVETWVEPCMKSDYIVITSAHHGYGVLVIDTKGTTSTSDDRIIHFTSFTDQDGNKFSPTSYSMAEEDHRGMVWIASLDGIIEIDPTKAFDADFRCNRIKVPRNDGTNYADYLLGGEQVNCISTDPAGRKWVATQNSGIYLVSETGDKILDHFTTDNSPLPTNIVNTIHASSTDNMVYVGTNYGPMTYSSDASPAADNLDNVYAYPNPVRPDYSGWITVAGLMEGSLVKITDASGTVVNQGRSEGGMYVWDGCNLGGDRVRSGVYFVLASENNSGSNYSAVTKIMVIN